MLDSWWLAAVGCFFDLHRGAYAGLTAHIRALGEGQAAVGVAILFAFALGMLHALSPGHGKTVVFSYFLGHSVRPWAGMAMASKVAATHVGSGALLVLLVGQAATAWGRPAGVAVALQAASHAVIALAGGWLLLRAIRRPSAAAPDSLQEDHSHPARALPFAIGVLSCPLTMLILTYAIAHATLLGGLALVGVMRLGIMAIIGAVGTLAILARRRALRWLDPQAGWCLRLCRTLEASSAAVMLCAGLWLLLAGDMPVFSGRLG